MRIYRTSLKHVPTAHLLSFCMVVASALATPLALSAQRTDEVEKIVLQVERELQGGNLAVSIYDVTQSRPVYSHNASMAMTPASLQKLFTVGAGFEKLHSDFRFSTRLGITGTVDRDGVLHGNIYIVGGGDPLLGSYRYRQTSSDSLFASWTTALRGRGIRKVEGRVCYNTAVFDDQPLHDTWQWGDVGNYYAAGVYGLNFHENMFFVYFNPAKKVGHPASVVRIEPKALNIHGTCEVTTGSENSGDNVVVYGSPYSTERLYRGTVPLGKADFRVRAAMPHPARSCADLFATYLRTHGVGLSSTTMEVYSLPDSLRFILEYKSSDYYTIAQYTNLTSNNLYAEAIFKYLGYQRFGKGSFGNGAKVVVDYFRELGLDAATTSVVDGSGLSLLNHTSSDFLCRYLAAMARRSYYEQFLHTLPLAGQSGTARNLSANLPKGVKVYVKTGTLTGVKSYAGYLITPKGDTYAFAIMADRYSVSSASVAEKLNRILHRIATTF